VLKDIAWLAAHPEARAADLMEVLKDPSIHGVISTIGGDDSIRMLPFLDFSVIRENPKVFLGYSDSTITHFAFLKAGVTSFYGPSIMAGFDENGGLPPYTAESVRQVLFEPSPSLLIPQNSGGWTVASWDWASEMLGLAVAAGEGAARGHLIGGCLEALDWLRGTPIWPEPPVWRNSIVFLETSEDQPSPKLVTYMLRALAATGALSEARGILYGRPFGDEAKFEANEAKFEAYDRAILQVLAELGLSSLPLVTRMDFGHTDPKFILPIGIEAEIDCDRQQIRLLESPTIW
jgi:muramoyltetrapeptide carboxypeptidase LdcA involved in peptidoglycan recycling